MSATAQAYAMNWVTDHLAVGHAPMSNAQLESLADQGVDAILNLCGEFCDLHDIEVEHGFEVHYLPVTDEEAPDLAEMEKALEWLDEAIYLGKKVLIHCRHGIGRTGTVLNAYLLRRGLGHKLAGRKLKGLKSKPANFDQWWAIRKYGRRSGMLKVRDPSLEFKNLVDLGPFFADYEALAIRVEDLLSLEDGGEGLGRCGREHTQCCCTPVRLTLVEAVYLAGRINQDLTSGERLAVIDRAVAVAGKERAEDALHHGEDVCLSGAGTVCPLLVDDACLLYEYRPLQCRTYELDEDTAEMLWTELLAPGLADTSDQLFFAFTSSFSGGSPLTFGLPDVVSGKYVQTFFHALMKSGR